MNERLQAILLDEQASLREAMTVIDKGAVEIALMVDAEHRLLGTVSDGDIRRALLGGADLDDAVTPSIARQPKVVGPETGRAEVLDLMRAQTLNQIPVVDAQRRVVGLHVLQELLGAAERDNWAVIMAGGRGTRLAPLTDHLPKPMLKVAGRPILERLVLHLVGSGVRRIFLSVNYLAEMVEEHFGDGSDFGCTIEYLREERGRPLGTGGALGLLADLGHEPRRPLLAMNGDLVTQFSVADLLSSHDESGALATVAVRAYAHDIPFGVVHVDGTKLVRFQEKPVASWPINAGIYVLDPRLLPRVPRGELFPLPGLLEDCLRRGEPVNVWRTTDDWQDIGRPGELASARGQA